MITEKENKAYYCSIMKFQGNIVKHLKVRGQTCATLKVQECLL